MQGFCPVAAPFLSLLWDTSPVPASRSEPRPRVPFHVSTLVDWINGVYLVNGSDVVKLEKIANDTFLPLL
jgi:hypothetical protein